MEHKSSEKHEREGSWKSKFLLQTQDLRVDQEKESCIGFTQENSIENSV